MDPSIQPIKTLIADDHRMVREGLKAMILARSRIQDFAIEDAETTEEAIVKTGKVQYNLILMDYRLPDNGGPVATETILQKCPRTRILAISNYDEGEVVERMIKAGAVGFALKNIEPDTLMTAIKTILSGKRYYSNEIALRIMNKSIRIRPTETETKPLLSSREQEILKLIAKGMSGTKIAEKLLLSIRTVDTHRQNILRKLDTTTAAGAVSRAFESGLL